MLSAAEYRVVVATGRLALGLATEVKALRPVVVELMGALEALGPGPVEEPGGMTVGEVPARMGGVVEVGPAGSRIVVDATGLPEAG